MISNAPAVDLSKLAMLSDVIEAVGNHRVIFVGESHTSFGSHDVQLEVIRQLAARGRKIAIGMEMFQRPFQQALDRYIAGTTDERTFLKETGYFSRWGYNYHLYKPIIDFARAEKIPVLALNARKELVDKVAKDGIDTLPAAEKEELPKDIDQSDEEYRERLRKVYNAHTSPDRGSFDNFVQAQLLWDETMAGTAAGYLTDNPDRAMVVLAGSGHVAYGTGIPKRLFRKTGIPYKLVLTDGEVEKGIADYLVMPPSREGEKSPQLGVMLKDAADRVMVTGFSPHGNAGSAGLEEGDEILSIDNEAVSKAEDLRVILFFKKPGDTVVITVKRQFLFWIRTLEIPVALR